MILKTFKVSMTIYDNKEHTAKSSGCDVDTLMQAQNYQQIQKMVEAQYAGCAQLRYAIPIN